MGYSGKLKEKGLAIKLREEGKSYRYIKKAIGVSMDTISRWCKNVEISPSQISTLYENRKKGSVKGSLIGAKRNQEKRIEREKILDERGRNEVGLLSKRDRFIAGVSLYFAEGSKTGTAVEFTNSDPLSVVFMVEWLEEFVGINRKKLKFGLWLHDNLNEDDAKKYWCQLLGIEEGQFHKTYWAKNKKDSLKIRKNVHEYGIIRVRHFNIDDLRVIKGWISGVLTPNSR